LRHLYDGTRGINSGATTGTKPAGSAILRRQAAIRRLMPAGSSRGKRLDPFALPLRFWVGDATADESIRAVELTPERVVLRRSVRGMLMAVNLPVKSYLGVALRIEPPVGAAEGAVALVLEHRDCALSLPLYRAADTIDVVAEWQSWARVLRLPLLVAEADGRLREPFARIGALRVGAAVPRRRQRGSVKRRRPSIFLRRGAGGSLAQASVHRGEREIIARS
jgi:Family of unknown function (DUF6101)